MTHCVIDKPRDTDGNCENFELFRVLLPVGDGSERCADARQDAPHTFPRYDYKNERRREESGGYQPRLSPFPVAEAENEAPCGVDEIHGDGGNQTENAEMAAPQRGGQHHEPQYRFVLFELIHHHYNKNCGKSEKVCKKLLMSVNKIKHNFLQRILLNINDNFITRNLKKQGKNYSKRAFLLNNLKKSDDFSEII